MKETFLSYLSAIATSEKRKYKDKKKEKKFNFFSIFYASIISFLILCSLSTLLLNGNDKNTYSILFSIIEIFLFFILILDYLLRFFHFYVKNKNNKSNPYYFLLWPFSFTSIILIIAILPSFYIINIWTNSKISEFNFLENLKFLRIFRLFLFLKLFSFTTLFIRVFQNEKKILITVFFFILLIILTFALVIYNMENENVQKIIDANLKPIHRIRNFGDAIYYSTIALTTIGFGDITPITNLGRWLTIIMSIMGVAIIAIPTSIISSGFISEAKKLNYEKLKNQKVRNKSNNKNKV